MSGVPKRVRVLNHMYLHTYLGLKSKASPEIGTKEGFPCLLLYEDVWFCPRLVNDLLSHNQWFGDTPSAFSPKIEKLNGYMGIFNGFTFTLIIPIFDIVLLWIDDVLSPPFRTQTEPLAKSKSASFSRAAKNYQGVATDDWKLISQRNRKHSNNRMICFFQCIFLAFTDLVGRHIVGYSLMRN